MMAQRILHLFLLDQAGPWSLAGGTLSVLGAQERAACCPHVGPGVRLCLSHPPHLATRPRLSVHHWAP